jgi:hypothetical protein
MYLGRYRASHERSRSACKFFGHLNLSIRLALVIEEGVIRWPVDARFTQSSFPLRRWPFGVGHFGDRSSAGRRRPCKSCNSTGAHGCMGRNRRADRSLGGEATIGARRPRASFPAFSVRLIAVPGATPAAIEADAPNRSWRKTQSPLFFDVLVCLGCDQPLTSSQN